MRRPGVVTRMSTADAPPATLHTGSALRALAPRALARAAMRPQPAPPPWTHRCGRSGTSRCCSCANDVWPVAVPRRRPVAAQNGLNTSATWATSSRVGRMMSARSRTTTRWRSACRRATPAGPRVRPLPPTQHQLRPTAERSPAPRAWCYLHNGQDIGQGLAAAGGRGDAEVTGVAVPHRRARHDRQQRRLHCEPRRRPSWHRDERALATWPRRRARCARPRERHTPGKSSV